jgi:hypothetical protein
MKCLMTRAIAAVLVATASAMLSTAVWGRCAKGAEYEQPDAVKRRYPDPPVRFDTPAFAAGATGFTTYEQMLAYVRALAERTSNLSVSTAGYSQEGRVLPLLLFTRTPPKFGSDACGTR